MQITTKFNVGDPVLTIDAGTMKVKKFEVAKIGTFTSNGKTTVTLYDGNVYDSKGYDENKCFSSQEELVTYITSDDDAKAV